MLLNLLNLLRKSNKMLGKPRILSLFPWTCLLNSLKQDYSCKILYLKAYAYKNESRWARHLQQFWSKFSSKTIRIYHDWEDGIEKSVPRITDWHHEACWVMTNGDHKGRIFQSHAHTNNGFFFLLTTKYLILYWKKYEKSFLKNLNTLKCDMVTSF